MNYTIRIPQPAHITTVDLHGTGTPLGDPIEVGAVAAVLVAGGRRVLSGPTAPAPAPLTLSAGKSKAGHTEAASGALGLAHALLGLGSQQPHPLLHLRAVNPMLEASLAAGAGGHGCAPAWMLPRGAMGGPSAQTPEAAVTGVSAFAFQVGPEQPG